MLMMLQSSLFQISMSNNATQFVLILDGSNYGLWSTAMRAFLMSLGLWAHIIGTTAALLRLLMLRGK